MSTSTSDAARTAWNRLYSTQRVKFKRGDPEPFQVTKDDWLGTGGLGVVHKTDLGNATMVALKRVEFKRRERDFFLNELNILEKLSGRRHQHVIELIGCYELPLARTTQIGILIWPVATYDLAQFFGFVDGVVDLASSLSTQKARGGMLWTLNPEEPDDLEEVLDLVRPQWKESIGSQQVGYDFVMSVLEAAMERLRTVFGCLAEVIVYLHNDQQIRHKDLKPAQVLMSPQGLWLTDFGWSMDISQLSNSATNNGDTISVKYLAPERATRGQYCGRSEDIFALGCIYLEIAYRLCRFRGSPSLLNPTGVKGWSYQANLDQKETWLRPLDANPAVIPENLMMLISRMMDRNAARRPLIDEVVEILRRGVAGKDEYFGHCCT